MLDPEVPLLGDARDLTVTAAAFGTLSLPVTTVIVTENLVNFLALPERPGTLAIYGGGYGFSSLRDAALAARLRSPVLGRPGHAWLPDPGRAAGSPPARGQRADG